MPDVPQFPARLADWLDAARRSLVAGMSGYRPPGARPGQSPLAHSPCSPSRDVRFMFASDTDDPVCAWRATLLVPANAVVGTPLALTVVDARGLPVADGAFRLAGCVVPLADGRGSLPFEVFVGGLKDVRVALVRQGRPDENGTLAFFDLEDA